MKKTTLTAMAVSIAVGSLAISTAANAKPRGQKMPSFEQLDTNGDGVITVSDIEAAAAAKFAETDANGDGYIDADELIAKMGDRGDRHMGGKRSHGKDCDKEGQGDGKSQELMQAQKAERQALAVKHKIERVDANGDGKIGMDEIKQPNIGKMFEHLDADGNGEISQDEWNDAEHKRRHRQGRRG